MTPLLPRRAALATLAAGALCAAAASASDVQVRPIGGTTAQMAALLARGGDGGPLRAAATAVPLALRAASVPVLVVVEIDGASLLDGHPGGRLGIEAHLYAVAAGGRIAAARSEGIAIDLARAGDAVASSGVRWLVPLDLPPGDYALRVLLRERRTGSFGLREVRLLLTSPGDGGATFLAAVVPSTVAWVDAPSPALDSATLERLAAEIGVPAAFPVLPAASAAAIQAWVGGGSAPELAAQLTDSRGASPAPAELEPAGASPIGEGLEALRFAISLPERQGLQDLRLAGAEGTPRALPQRVVLRPAEEAVAWNQIARVAPVTAATQSASVAPPLASKADRRRLRAAYDRAFGRFARGERVDSVLELAAFEQGALDAERRRAMGWLEAAEAEALASAVARERQALLPLSLFYRDLHATHLEQGRIGLARRSERIAERLLGQLAETAADDEERRLAAAALESLAAELIEVGAPGRAADLLKRSADLVPDRVGIWVALGALYERDQRYADGALALDRALGLQPRHREARLRRARLYGLAGDAKRCAAELDALLAEPVADWIGVVAAQERVRALFAEGAFAAAAERLAAVAARHPGEPSLGIALAYALERAADRAGSRAAIARAAVADRAYAQAPRKLYAEPPRLLLAAGRAEVETAALLRLDALAAALGATSGNGRGSG